MQVVDVMMTQMTLIDDAVPWSLLFSPALLARCRMGDSVLCQSYWSLLVGLDSDLRCQWRSVFDRAEEISTYLKVPYYQFRVFPWAMTEVTFGRGLQVIIWCIIIAACSL